MDTHGTHGTFEVIVPIVYRISEIARLLQLGRSSAYRLIESGDLPSIRMGRSVRVLRTDLDSYLARRRRAG